MTYRVILLAAFVLATSCATTMDLKEPVTSEGLETKLRDLGRVQRISSDRVDLVHEDSGGPRPEDVAAINERNVKAKEWMPVQVGASGFGARERVLQISINDDGRELELKREVRSCFESGQGLSGIPVGGGCVDSETTQADVEWFESAEAAIRARL